MDRRAFLFSAAAGATALASAPTNEPTWAKLPRWRGFNLLEKCYGQRNRPFLEHDFALMADWGFNFVRLPLSYQCWSSAEKWRELNEKVLQEIDQAVEFGKQYKMHVNINFHRAPGYCVNPPAEPFDLWKDEAALEACAFHWAHFAKRYKGIPNAQVSFNLLNEPAKQSAAEYVKVARRLITAIREHDPERLIIADGLEWGRVPVPGLIELKVAQSTRGYDPMPVTHYKANWVQGADKWPVPTWPLVDASGKTWDRARLLRERIEPWKALERRGVGIHVGEWGCHQYTPHPVVLAWMRDQLALWREAGWGWALWNLRGNFGVLDSERTDVKYASMQGQKLDPEMLEVIRAG